jgi:potassium/chloride transporter 9
VAGHVIVEPDFGSAVPEARRQQAAWTKFIEVTRVKAFVSITISPAIEWGVRNIVLGAGLGGMRPNITVLGFYNMDDLRSSQALTAVPRTTSSQPSNTAIQEHASQDGTLPKKGQDLPQEVPLPTDSCETEKMVGAMNYVMVLEDLLLRLQVNVAVAKGFKDLKLPQSKNNSKLYIDLWPIQMSAEIASEGEGKANMLTTNFDTCKLSRAQKLQMWYLYCLAE